MRSALVHRERGEPSENGGSGVRVRSWVRVAVGGPRVVEGDVGCEGVEELLSGTHRNIL